MCVLADLAKREGEKKIPASTTTSPCWQRKEEEKDWTRDFVQTAQRYKTIIDLIFISPIIFLHLKHLNSKTPILDSLILIFFSLFFLFVAVNPNTKCKLKLLRTERIKDYLLMEEEFIQDQERMKPAEEKLQVRSASLNFIVCQKSLPKKISNFTFCFSWHAHIFQPWFACINLSPRLSCTYLLHFSRQFAICF
jgi:hypothetical protein